MSRSLLAFLAVLLARPAAAGAPAVIDDSDACPTRSEHPDFTVRRADIAARSASDVARAREAARDLLLGEVCGGDWGSARCLALGRATVPLGQGAFNRRHHTACASVAVDKRLVGSREAEQAAVDTQMETFGARIGAALPSSGAVVGAPVWAGSDCPIGELGRWLGLAVAGALPVPTLASGHGAPAVRIAVATDGQRVRAQALIRQPGESGWTAIPGAVLVFAADLVGPLEVPASCSDVPLEPTGLSLTLDASGPAGLVCPGESIRPCVALDGPARVRLYSVRADGSAVQVWPRTATDDRVYGPGDDPILPELSAVPNADGFDTRLVAVAYTSAAPPPGLCVAERGIPGEPEAHDSLVWRIPGPWDPACASRADPDLADRLAEGRSTLPPCPIQP